MVAAVAPSIPAAAQTARSSPSLDAELRTYRAQLADWVTCPSAKTPQGKAKIAKISEKLESVKVAMKESGATSAAKAVSASPPVDVAPRQIESGDGWRPPARPGALVDTYA